MSQIYRYRLWCITEGCNVYCWNPTPPTACPNNNTHTIDPSTITAIDSVTANTVAIQEEAVPTGGHLTSECYAFTANAGTASSTVVTFPIPVNILYVAFNSDKEHVGNQIELQVGPNTAIGVLTSNVSSNVSIIPVSNTVIQYAALGLWISLTDGVNFNDLGRVTAIDNVNNNLTTVNPTVNSFAAGTGVLMTVKYIQNFYIGSPGYWSIGQMKFGAAYIPTGIPVVVLYTNNSSNTSTLYAKIGEFYFSFID
jgi:hypothetical protein